jgi:hypothetical protein
MNREERRLKPCSLSEERARVDADGTKRAGAYAATNARTDSGVKVPCAGIRAAAARMPAVQQHALTAQPAVAFAAEASSVATDLAVISRPFLFMSKRCLRSRLLTNSRTALPTPPGRLDGGLLFGVVAVYIAEVHFK